MNILVRAYTEDGYHRDIVVASEKQVWRTDSRVGELPCIAGPTGFGGSILVADFPEAVRFELIISEDGQP